MGVVNPQFEGAGGWPVSMDTYYPFGTEASPPGDASHYKFSGKERDSESGNDYFGARYYSSAMGRFMTPDWSAKAEPVPYAKLDNPQSLNLYEYALNNPLSGVDKDGHSSDTGCGVDGKPAQCSFNDKRTNKPQNQQQSGQYAVTLNGRTANVTGGSLMHVMGADHVWITTSDGKSVGMGTAKGGGGIPDKNGGSSPDKPGDPTQLVDEHGDAPTWTRTFTNVNRAAMDSYLTPGKQTGAWIPSVNDCNTWADNAIGQSTPHDVYNMHTEQWTHNAVVYADGSVHVVQ